MGRRLSHAHWGAFSAEVEKGTLVEIKPFDLDSHPSPLMASVVSAVHAESRIRQPAVREGYLSNRGSGRAKRRGGESFISVSWDEALDLVAAALAEVKQRHGNSAIFGGSYGWSSAGRVNHARTLLHRFLNKFGGHVGQVTNYSWGAAAILLPHIVGGIEPVAGPVTDWSNIVKHTQLMVMFGGASLKNARITTGGAGSHDFAEWLARARQAGIDFVNISPLASDAPALIEAEWLPIVPGSDAALMMALSHTLIVESLVDRDFIERFTVGYGAYRDYLLGKRDGQPKNALWASAITGIAKHRIVALARRMAAERTMLSATWSLQRADHGEQPYWALIALASMLGQIGLPGGGFGFGYGSINGMGTPRRSIPTPTMEAGANPLDLDIPVARIADLLLKPGQTIAFDGRTITFPDIKLVYWCGGNPFHHHQDLNRLLEAWSRPETVIVQDIWWTAAARHADIVLPATTAYEREDIGASPRDRFVIAMSQLIPPLHQARNDYDIFTALAERLGFRDDFTERRDIKGWIRYCYEVFRGNAKAGGIALPEFELFWETGYVELPPPERDWILYEPFRKDPERHPLKTPSGRIEIFSKSIADFGYADCPGHPTWIPPKEWHGSELLTRYPLYLISNQPATRLHGQLDDGWVSRQSKIAGREPVWINPFDAAQRNIATGDIVRLFNDRGQCLAGARVTDEIRPGVVQLSAGAWYNPEHPGVAGSLDLHGNPNVLTRDEGTSSLGQGPSLSTLVEIERHRAAAASISVFTPPIAHRIATGGSRA